MARPAAIDFGTLCDELDALVSAPPTRNAVARKELERTLTDGYASALSLEGERLRLERRIGEVAAGIKRPSRNRETEELADLSLRLSQATSDLTRLRELLVQLRQRVSAAA